MPCLLATNQPINQSIEETLIIRSLRPQQLITYPFSTRIIASEQNGRVRAHDPECASREKKERKSVLHGSGSQMPAQEAAISSRYLGYIQAYLIPPKIQYSSTSSSPGHAVASAPTHASTILLASSPLASSKNTRAATITLLVIGASTSTPDSSRHIHRSRLRISSWRAVNPRILTYACSAAGSGSSSGGNSVSNSRVRENMRCTCSAGSCPSQSTLLAPSRSPRDLSAATQSTRRVSASALASFIIEL